jgi:hypothetical protein
MYYEWPARSARCFADDARQSPPTHHADVTHSNANGCRRDSFVLALSGRVRPPVA